MLRYSITFVGNVQGVGFRYTAIRIARDFNVTGWVRNEADGSVKCVAEGEKVELDRLVAAIEDAMRNNIENTTVQTGPATGEFRDFSIAR